MYNVGELVGIRLCSVGELAGMVLHFDFFKMSRTALFWIFCMRQHQHVQQINGSMGSVRGSSGYTSKAALLGLIGEDTDYFEGLKRGNRVAATQLAQIRGICLETSECDLPTFQFSPVMSRRII